MEAGARPRPFEIAHDEVDFDQSARSWNASPTCARVAVIAALVAAIAASASTASAQDYSSVQRELGSIEEAASRLTSSPLQVAPARSATYVEERLTDGELFYRLHDYLRASIILSDIVDNFPNHRSAPDALYLLADSLFQAGDLLGARRRFQIILDRANDPTYRPFFRRALGRLVEIAIRTRDFTGVEDYFQRLAQMPPSEIEGSATYFRAKYLYNRAVPYEDTAVGQNREVVGQLDTAKLQQALDTFEQVPATSEFAPQARYFIGVIHVLRQEFPQAIEAFRAVAHATPDTADHRAVVELASLALGRVYYETDKLPEAVDAYQSVPRTSTYFARALFEIAWVYIRQGDAVKAERALEVLSVAAPDSPLIPDAKLLRGNLLLREQRFDDAMRVFREVRDEFGPVRQELDAVAVAHPDLPTYFRQLVQSNLDDFDIDSFLPESARRWTVLEGDEFERASGIVRDLATVRQLVRETSDLIDRLNGALQSANAVNLFSDLRGQRESSEALRNRLVGVEAALLRVEEQRSPVAGPELTEARARRVELEGSLSHAPTRAEAFGERSASQNSRLRELGGRISELEVQVMGLEARVVATERFLEQTQGQQPNEATIRAELANHRAAIASYREAIVSLRRDLELARLSIGVGDDDFSRDRQLRDEHDALVTRERQLSGAAGGAGDAYIARIEAVRVRLTSRDEEVERVVAARVANMRRVVDEESTNVVGYRQTLASLETESQDVVGGVTYMTFENVRHRFYDLVLRADVGRIDVAWQRREQHRVRIETLTRDRANELQRIDDEFREITEGGP